MEMISKDFLVKNGLIVNSAASIYSITNSTSTSTGALVVRGGAGIGGDLWVAGTLHGSISGGSVTSPVSSATNAQNVQVKDVAPNTQYYIALAETRGNSFSGLDAAAALVYNSANNLLTIPAVSASSISVDNNLNIGGTLNISGGMGTVSILGYNGVSFLTADVHNFIVGDTVIPQTSGLGLTAQTTYYIKAIFSPYRFILSATPSGSGVGSVGTQTIVAYAGEVASLRISAMTSATSTTTGAMVIAGGVGIGGNLYVGGRIIGGGVRSTTSDAPPDNPVIGDIWYNGSADVLYRYTLDGADNVYWLDITGPSVLAHII
jgi:hypothetical protein